MAATRRPGDRARSDHRQYPGDHPQRRAASLLGEQVEKVQRAIGMFLRAGWSRPAIDRGAAQDVYAVLRRPMPAPFVRHLRTLHVEYGRTGDLARLLGELQPLAGHGQRLAAPGRSPFFLGVLAAWLDPDGSACVVEAPPELVELFKKAIREMVDAYGLQE